MNLKTSPKQAIELASVDIHGRTELLGIEPLKEVSLELKYAVDNKAITSDNTFNSIFGLDYHFFYSLHQFNKDTLIAAERGIGKLEIIDNKVFLIREFPIEDNTKKLCSSGCVYFNCSDCDHVVAQSSVPVTYAECLFEDNVLISSRSPFFPHIIRTSPNSIIGRLDKDLECLSFSELLSDKNFQNELINLLKKYNKQMVLGCSKLSAKKIQTSSIQLDKADSSVINKNSVVLDNNELKFYDGENWHRILMEKI